MTVRAKWHGAAVKDAEGRAVLAGLAAAAEHILAESNRRVPLEEGTLERSGTVVVDRPGLVAVISYDTPYAVVQHEDLTFRHDEGRSAKYLELALIEQGDQARELMAARIRRALGGGSS